MNVSDFEKGRKASQKIVRSSPEIEEADRSVKIFRMAPITLEQVASLLDKKLGNVKQSMEQKLENMLTVDHFQVLMSEIKSCNDSHKELHNQVETLRKQNAELQKRIELLEKNSRKKNVIIKGLAVSSLQGGNSQEQVANTVKCFFKSALKLEEDIHVVDAYRMGKVDGGIRPICVQMQRSEDLFRILKASSKLGNTPIFISKDLSVGERSLKRKIFKIRSELKKWDPKMEVVVKDFFMNVNGDNFYFKEGHLFNKEGNAYVILERMTGKSFKEVIEGILAADVFTGVQGGNDNFNMQSTSMDV